MLAKPAALLLAVLGGGCSRPCPELDPETLDRSLALGTAFLLRHQKPEGNFDYAYDWVARRQATDDNPVRQAGATWGLALIHQDQPTPETRAAVARALAFFDGRTRSPAEGQGFVVYPGTTEGKLGTMALVALARIDMLRAEGDALMPAERAAWQAQIDRDLAFLVAARRPDGLFAGGYDHATGQLRGEPSPYSDGEALLALTKVAVHLGRLDLRPLVLETAEAGYGTWVTQALAADPDSDRTKGYYQWGSMAWYELVQSGWSGTEVWAQRLIALADWMIDVHKTLSRGRNTGYAYEGIVPAYATARALGDEAHAEKFRCTIQAGLGKLTALQVGHPLANRWITRQGPPDEAAVGGVQNHAEEPELRIDVAQHQMHAVILARRHLVGE